MSLKEFKTYLKPQAFDKNINSWVYSLKPNEKIKTATNINKLTLVSYNIGSTHLESIPERFQELFKVLQSAEADIICLQEGINNFIT